MSCNNDYNNICRQDIPYPQVSPESVPSLISNLVYALYGDITKSVENGRVVWNIPCDPNNTAEVDQIPREEGEGLLCYLLRVFANSLDGYGSFLRWGFAGSGQTAFTLTGAWQPDRNAYIAYIDGVVQDPINYTISTTLPRVLTLDTALPSGSFLTIVELSSRAGATGASGAVGSTGATGVGVQGSTGPQGATGIGATGATGQPAVSLRFSSTSNTIGLGNKTFTYDAANVPWAFGYRVRAVRNATNYMEGNVIAINDTSVTIAVDEIVGSGTYTFWNIGLAMEVGATGPVGPQGATGFGATGPVGPQGSTGVGSTGATGEKGATGVPPVITRQSFTSHDISLGQKIFYYSPTAEVGWTYGSRLRAVAGSAYPPDWVEGNVVEVNNSWVELWIDTVQGAGNFADWIIGIAGDGGLGATGATGPQGDPGGATGSTGATGVGIQGSTGATGLQGEVGATGVGATGSTGLQGATGLPGQSASFYNYQADAVNTSGVPAAGRIIWDNLTQTSATTVTLSHIDSLGNDIDVFFPLFKTGDKFVVQDQGNSNNYQTWEISSTPTVAVNSYVTIPVTLVTSGGTSQFIDAQNLIFAIVSSGLVGATGPVGATGIGATGATGPVGATGIGATGATGPVGATGIGATGATGVLPPSNFGGVWSYIGDGIQTVFAITGGLSILSPAYLVHVDGVYQKSTNYTIDNVIPRTLTFSTPIPAGSEITIVSISVA